MAVVNENSEARATICALVHEYCYRLDGGDLDGVAELFAHAQVRTTRHPDRVLRGAAEVRTLYEPVILYGDGTPSTQHHITNTTVTFASSTAAAARSYFMVVQALDGAAPQIVLTGEYRDEFECVDGCWRFAQRVIVARHLGSLTRHMQR